MFLTPDQLRDVLAIVERHHNAFIANFVSPSALPPETLAKLEAAGIVKPQVQGIRDAYMFGVLAANLPGGGGQTVSYAQLADRLARNPFPLSAVEKQAVSVAQMSAGQYISGLGAKVQTQVSQAIMEADKAAQRRRTQADRGRADANGLMMVTDQATAQADAAAYKQVIAEGIEQRKQLGSIVSDLGHATGEWLRDLERVAVTETANAMQQGTAQHLDQQFGADAIVAKLHAANCCDNCRRLLTDSATGKPKLFKLADLQGNGSNYGRKAKDWLAVVGPIHPNCFSGDTTFITPSGVRRLKDAVGEKVQVIGQDGDWQDACIEHFGQQPLMRIVLEKRHTKKVIHATANHRWFRRQTVDYGRHYSECVTAQLAPGNSLKSRLPSVPSKLIPSPIGVCHGIVFGDGTRPSEPCWPASVTLYEEKICDLAAFFSNCQASSESKGGLRVGGLPRSWKNLPDLNESSSYLYGWLVGYFATDGHAGKDSSYVLKSKIAGNLEHVERICIRLGIATGSMRSQTTTGYGNVPNRVFVLSFNSASLRSDFFVRRMHLERFLARKQKMPSEWRVLSVEPLEGDPQDVYCAVVPKGQAFTLEDYIYTGNCACTLVHVPPGMTFDDKGFMVAESTLDKPKPPKT